MPKLTYLQEEILKILQRSDARYSKPLNSFEMAKRLNITPSYIRQTIVTLKKHYRVGVRRGSGGGFFLREQWSPHGHASFAGRSVAPSPKQKPAYCQTGLPVLTNSVRMLAGSIRHIHTRYEAAGISALGD